MNRVEPIEAGPISRVSIPEAIRGVSRTFVLFAMLVACLVHGMIVRPQTLAERSRWRRRWSQRMLDGVGIQLTVQGDAPRSGVLAANHLGYLDVLTFGTLNDAVFVAKDELQTWPLIGQMMRIAGTIFIDRSSVRSAAAANRRIGEALTEGVPVTFFPEGTSSGGTSVLPVQSPLFEAPSRAGAPIWPAVAAVTADGSLEHSAERICYWGDMTFGPHLLRMLATEQIQASILIASAPLVADNRRAAAAATEAALKAMLPQVRNGVASDGAMSGSTVQQTALA